MKTIQSFLFRTSPTSTSIAMSTRSRTRSGVSKALYTTPTPKLQTKSTQKGPRHNVDISSGHEGKEVKAKISSVKPRKTKKYLRSVLCFCSKDDDGSPMILCSECKIWYHFTCVDLNEPEAEEISVYVCPTCTETTGRRSALTWEGDQAVEECTDDDEAIVVERRNAVLRVHHKTPEVKIEVEESDEGPSSEDEYVDDMGKNKSADRRRTRQFSSGSDSDSANESGKRRLSRIKASPSASASYNGHLKRKAANISESSPPSKKKKASEAVDDPARKYCLGKLEELFRDVFLRYPHVRSETTAEDVDVNDNKTKIIPKKIEELSEEEKEALINEAKQFARHLEECVYDIYSEPDKQGNPHAGGKYKDRFRMLQFNLSKVDRVIIHQRITSGNISPKEISQMSSTDLADEETKQSIKIAEKEALEHSILQKSTAPRAKITHKGLQDIEDVNGEVASAREIERQREQEQEEEERRERERMARLRTVQRQRTTSVSVPPESPTVLQSPSEHWGAPPPVPLHAMSPPDEVASPATSRAPLFTNASHSSAEPFAEPELNLADLINIDDDQEAAGGVTSSSPPNRPAIVKAVPSPIDTSAPVQSMSTGISPFAARPRAPSFDLNALWNAPRNEPSTTPTEPLPPPTIASTDVQSLDGDKDDNMDLESQEANDQDFDMFLDEKEPEAPVVLPAVVPQNVEALPQVWSGKITMPLDSSMPQETSLVARQVGGRILAPESPLWKTLFPSDLLRIEGRVPVENSTKYLLQMRLNATKELLAAAFSPASESSQNDFNTLSNFLISKSRHGLVFPWGSRPKEYHPGRELYMVPLLQSETLPEYMELLDELKLPTIRTSDYIVGIWILNKGKLVPSPVPPALQGPPPRPAYPTPPNQSPPVPTAANSMSGLPIPPAIVAEVASLTPEQIQSVLQTLASTTRIPFSQVQQLVQPTTHPHMNSSHPSQPQMGAPPLWRNHPPPPPPLPPAANFPNFPPQNPVGTYQAPTHGMNSPHSLGSPHSQPRAASPYERQQDYSHEFRGTPYDGGEPGGRGDQSWRGNNRGRGGRGRGTRSDGFDPNARRPVDSGWPRRPRNEGSTGGPSW